VNNTAIGGNAIYNASRGKVHITGPKAVLDPDADVLNQYQGEGTWVHVDKLGGCAVNNVDVGEILIEGGLVEATGRGSIAVNNTSSGWITIKDDDDNDTTVQVTDAGSYAIYNDSFGTVNIYAGTIHSRNPLSNQGTVYFAFSSGNKRPTLNIGEEPGLVGDQGNVLITNSGPNGNAVYNNSLGIITIGNTNVAIATDKTDGYAIYNNNDNATVRIQELGADITGSSDERGPLYGLFVVNDNGTIRTIRYPYTQPTQ